MKPTTVVSTTGLEFELRKNTITTDGGMYKALRSCVKLAFKQLGKRKRRAKLYETLADVASDHEWRWRWAERVGKGAIAIGCQTFNREEVEVIRKWAFARPAPAAAKAKTKRPRKR